MNTEEHGIPQHRKRLYICGILKDNDTGNFEWPQPIPCNPLTEFLDKRNENIAHTGLPIPNGKNR